MMKAVNRQMSLPRPRRALTTVNEHTLLDQNQDQNHMYSIPLPPEIHSLKRASSLPAQQANHESADSEIVYHSHEIKKSASLSMAAADSENFQNAHVPDTRVTASFKSSQKIRRQLSEALLSKTTLGYDETLPEAQVFVYGGKVYSLLKREAMLLLNTYTDQSGSFVNIRNGLLIVAVLGAALGIWMPKNNDLPSPWYRVVSSILGYSYVMSWSICFYPQIIINVQRGSVLGLSTDSSVLQLVNLTAYAIYCTTFYFNSSIRHEYQDIHGKNAKVMVESSDVAFALHASLMSLVIVTQIYCYGGFKMTPMSKITKYILSVVVLWCTAYIILIILQSPGFLWIDFLYLLASIKIFLGIGSYLSQVLLNYQRKSTNGYNIWNIILDCTGGLLSLFQLVFDAADMNDLRGGIMGNWAKLIVSLVSLSFDVSTESNQMAPSYHRISSL